jgi:hypothetical protein
MSKKDNKILIIDIQQDFSVPPLEIEKDHIRKHIEFSNKLIRSGLLMDPLDSTKLPIFRDFPSTSHPNNHKFKKK